LERYYKFRSLKIIATVDLAVIFIPIMKPLHLPNITPPLSSEQRANQLNYHGQIADKTLLHNSLQDNLYAMLIEQRLHLFADSVVFVADSVVQQQQQLISAIESVVTLPSYQQYVLAFAPDSAQFEPKARGVFLGYDFHGTQLIEINTNAGGAMLNALLLPEQDIAAAVMTMFQAEWQAERGSQTLRTIAIIDEQPETQFLFPEFILFKQLFEQQGIKTVICDPSELSYRDGSLWHENLAIDLIYNRLTDFALEEAEQHALRCAYLEGAVVLTPHPRAHALYADKRNLAVLTDKTLLQTLGVDEQTIRLLLAGIAHTVRVNTKDADSLWAERKRLFFKPTKGYGSKAVYRGDKLTKRVFADILANDYVAQTQVPPNESGTLKFDIRQYAYRDQLLLTSSRLYQGQTTNFRTVGGGFARVEIVSS
jgi:hypothetical protein